MNEGKLVKTKLEVEAKEYEQKHEYKGVLDALYEEGQDKGYEYLRSYIAPCVTRAYIAGAEPREKQLEKAKELLKKWVSLYSPKLKDFPKPPIQEETENFLQEN